MTPAAEQKMLKSVLKRLDNPVQPVLAARWLMAVVWLAFVLLVALFYALGEQVSHWLAAFGFVLLGVAYSHLWFRTASARAWPSLTPHFDRASIQARLRELES